MRLPLRTFAATLAIVANVFAVSAISAASAEWITESNALKIRPAPETVRGSTNAPITIVEYGDYQCPFTKKFHPALLATLLEYRGTVNWSYRHYPLKSIHPYAEPAARAGECVSSLYGKTLFWSYTDAMFRGNAKDYLAIAQGVVRRRWDKEAFTACMAEKKTAQRVRSQSEEARALNVAGTPTTFIIKNSTGERKVLKGAVSREDVKAAIQSLLNK